MAAGLSIRARPASPTFAEQFEAAVARATRAGGLRPADARRRRAVASTTSTTRCSPISRASSRTARATPSRSSSPATSRVRLTAHRRREPPQAATCAQGGRALPAIGFGMADTADRAGALRSTSCSHPSTTSGTATPRCSSALRDLRVRRSILQSCETPRRSVRCSRRPTVHRLDWR